MAKLTPDQEETRLRIKGIRKINRRLDGKGGLSSSDYDSEAREEAAAANRSARDAARAAAREARERKRQGQRRAAGVGKLQDEFTVPDADDLSTPVDVKRDPQGNIDTSGLSDDQIVNLGGGKYARFDKEIGEMTPVEFNRKSNKFEFQEPDPTVTAGQETLAKSLPGLITTARSFATRAGDSDLLGEVQQLQRDLDAINKDTSLDEEARTSAIAQLQERGRTMQEKVSTLQVEAAQASATQRAQEATATLQRNLETTEMKYEEELAKLLGEQAARTKTEAAARKQERDEQPTKLQAEYAAHSQGQRDLIEKFQELFQSNGGNAVAAYQQMGLKAVPTVPTYEEFVRARMVELGASQQGAEIIAPLVLQTERDELRMRVLSEQLSPAREQAFIKAMVGSTTVGPDGQPRQMTRQDAVNLYEEATAPLRMENMGIRVRHERTLQQIETLRSDYTIVNPGSATPITRAGLRALNADRTAAGKNPLSITEVQQLDRDYFGRARSPRTLATGGGTRRAVIGEQLPTIAKMLEQADGNVDEVRNSKRFGDIVGTYMRKTPEDLLALFPRGHKDRPRVEYIVGQALDRGFDSIYRLPVGGFEGMERYLRDRLLELGAQQQRVLSGEVMQREQQLAEKAESEEPGQTLVDRVFRGGLMGYRDDLQTGRRSEEREAARKRSEEAVQRQNR